MWGPCQGPHVGRRLVALGMVVTVAAVLTCCTWSHSERLRTLPADRNAPVLYVALGDSTVEGVAATSPQHTYVANLHSRLRAIYPAARVENLGVGGAVSADVVRSQLWRAVALQPDLVTLSIGPNDVTGGVPVNAYEENVGRIFTALRGNHAMVVVNLLPDLVVTPRFRRAPHRDAVAAMTVAFNDALGRQAEKHGVLVVDLYTASREEVPRRPELIAADGYHPSDAGYARWAELMWQVIEPRAVAH